MINPRSVQRPADDDFGPLYGCVSALPLGLAGWAVIIWLVMSLW
jgi:hypothetical protein